MSNHFSTRVVASLIDDPDHWDESSPETPDMTMAREHFLNLSGTVLDYYGADSGDHTFKIDDVVFKVLEDPEDGYRSMLGSVVYTGTHSSIFFRDVIAQVRIESFSVDEELGDGDSDYYRARSFKGYRHIDVEDGHVWLELGTDHSDDYYPHFTLVTFRKLQLESVLRSD